MAQVYIGCCGGNEVVTSMEIVNNRHQGTLVQCEPCFVRYTIGAELLTEKCRTAVGMELADRRGKAAYINQINSAKLLTMINIPQRKC